MTLRRRREIAAAMRQERDRWNRYTRATALSQAARNAWRLRQTPRERREIVPRGEADRHDLAAIERWHDCPDETHDPAQIAELREELEARLAALPPRDASATLRHLAHGQLLRHIGADEGLTRERVRQIVEQSAEVIRWHLLRSS